MVDLPQLWAELESRWPESIIDPSLTRIVSVMELLGDPQRAYPVIQVAGTNGKTSTARMIESVLRAYGLRTGLFTSPHLVDARERIRLDGEPVTAERLLDTWSDIEPYVRLVDKNSTESGGVPLSYFEVITSLAYAAFADAPVDVAIIEVGMGGTWDATSVAAASVAVITPISMDHTEYLGDTIEQIAGEKAGIIAPGCTAVTSRQTDDARSVVMTRASELDVPLKIEAEDFGLLSRAVAVGGQLTTTRSFFRSSASISHPTRVSPSQRSRPSSDPATSLSTSTSCARDSRRRIVRVGCTRCAWTPRCWSTPRTIRTALAPWLLRSTTPSPSTD